MTIMKGMVIIMKELLKSLKRKDRYKAKLVNRYTDILDEYKGLNKLTHSLRDMVDAFQINNESYINELREVEERMKEIDRERSVLEYLLTGKLD